jgi:hypothetical protein
MVLADKPGYAAFGERHMGVEAGFWWKVGRMKIEKSQTNS